MMKKIKSSEFDCGSVKGLLVGINYTGMRGLELGGCINDVHKVKNLIVSSYPNAELELMTDHTLKKPTRYNILTSLKALVANAKRGDTIIFDYSGHGSQVKDIHGDEEDGLDETICPLDFKDRRTVYYQGKQYNVDSQITNDEIHEIISDIPHGARFFMLSDSCHSGTIGHLKNDFLHYSGPNKWGDNHNGANSVDVDTSVVETIQCYASWNYSLGYGRKKEVSIRPYDMGLLKKFNYQKIIVSDPADEQMGRLYYYVNRVVILTTVFEKLNNGDYRISCPSINVKNLTVNIPRRSLDSSIDCNSSCDNQETQCNISSHYDAKTGKHVHVDHQNGEKRSFKMRSHNACKGGELRIISGCQESQTSADTGKNGACTLSFLNTVSTVGGLSPFFKKLFSHYIEDMKFIQDSINKYLYQHGFTQHSVLSWDHSSSNRSISTDGNNTALLRSYGNSLSSNTPSSSTPYAIPPAASYLVNSVYRPEDNYWVRSPQYVVYQPSRVVLKR